MRIAAVTAFLSAFLMFWLEFLVAKMVLPVLGGTPAVWTTSVVFFQALLLLGYFLAHQWSQLPVRRFVQIQMVAMTLAILQLPIHLKLIDLSIPKVFYVWIILIMTIGFVFLSVGTISPVLQDWQARAGNNPYRLYAIGNLGSFSSLFLYPTLIEMQFTVAQQRWICSALYLLLLGLMALTARRVAALDQTVLQSDLIESPSIKVRANWLSLSALPSSLMLSVTTAITTDVANIPLLWSVPLGLYLLTFVVIFSQTHSLPRFWTLKFITVSVVVLLIVLVTFVTGTSSIALHLLGLILLTFLLHHKLYESRPAPVQLTSFYLYVALGGLLGGLFNTLVAPMLFKNGVSEYPITLFVSLLLLVRGQPHKTLAARFSQGLLYGLLIVVLTVGLTKGNGLIASYRNFFGIYKVSQIGDLKVIIHNTTVHGAQKMGSTTPITYYSARSGVGELFEQLNHAQAVDRVGVIGLGAGSIYAYASAGQQWQFIELDPLVVQIARTHFDYLASRSASVDFLIGDGRAQLKEMSGDLDLLVVDAFSSDLVPPHLLTLQAIVAYVQKLKPGGILMFNLSNRYLDLSDVVGNVAHSLGLLTFVKHHVADSAEMNQGIVASTWVVVADLKQMNPAILQNLQQWQVVQPTDRRLWTDDYSNMISQFTVLKHGFH